MSITLSRTNTNWINLLPLAAGLALSLAGNVRAGDTAVMMAPGSTGDTTADAVLGQLDFAHRDSNFVDGRGILTNGGPWGGSGWGDVAVDTSVTPNRVYVADTANSRVLAWKDAAVFTTHAAAYSVIGQADLSSTTCNGNNGAPSAASLCYPTGVAVDSHGNLYVSDFYNHRVLYYANPLGVGKPRAGLEATDVFGQQGGFTSNACNAYGTEADTLCHPVDLVLDAKDNLYVSDSHNHRVLIYRTPQTITATRGSGDTTADKVLGQLGSFGSGTCNLAGVTADGLCNPGGLALDSGGNLFVADHNNHRVLKYLTPLSTNTTADQVYGQPNFASNACNDGGISASSLCYPSSVAVNGAGTLRYIADRNNFRVLGYTNADTVADLVLGQFGSFTTAACNNTKDNTLPPVNARSLCYTGGMALDASGNLHLADATNNRINKYAAPVTSTTPATGVLGQYLYTTGFGNALDGRGFATSDWPSQGTVAIDRSVVPNRVYVADTPNNRVLAWNDIAAFATHVPATKVFGQANMYTNSCNRGLSSPTSATLCNPYGVAVDALGNLYVADTNNHRVLEYHRPFATDTTADKVFGQGGDFTTAICNKGGVVTANVLCTPHGVALDGAGNLYVGDYSNNRVLEYHTPLATDTSADKVFGQANGFSTNACNLGGITRNSLCNPVGVAIDGAGNLYVADYSNNRVLEYNTPLTTDVAADIVFGQKGSFVSNGCNIGAVVSAVGLCYPYTVGVNSAGTVFIADTSNSRVLKYLSPLTTDRAADAVFGQSNRLNASGCKGVSPDTLCTPHGVALDSGDNLYITDAGNNRVLRYLTP